MSGTINVEVPELGKVEEVSLVEWKVSPGDEVTEGMEIAEIETMKSTFSVEAPSDGVIEEIFVDEGEKAKIEQPLSKLVLD